MNKDKLLEKIQKLFAMAEMGFGNEAEIAMRKALELMQEHGLQEKDVKLFTAEIPMRRKERWLCFLHSICAHFSGVVGLIGNTHFKFAGDEIGVNVAKELFYYLKNEINRLSKNTAGRKQKNDFRIGCVIGLQRKFEKLGGWCDMERKQEKVKEEYFKGIKEMSLRQRQSIDFSYAISGLEAANTININRQAGTHAPCGLISVD